MPFDENIQDDPEVAAEAIASYPWAIHDASDNVKKNKMIVLPAVTADGSTLQLVDADLQDDDDVVEAAFRNDSESIQYASERLQAIKRTEKKSIDS